MRAWEPEEGETGRAFSCFGVYRDLGATRTLKAAADLFYGGPDGATSAQYDQVRRWSSRHDWAQRAEHFDRWLQMERRDAVQRHTAERAEEHARRESELREKALEIRERAAERALVMLKAPLYTQEFRKEGPDGEDVTVVMVPAKWSLSTAVNLFNLSQNNAGPTAEEIEVSGELDFSSLSDDELSLLLELDGKIQVRTPER